MCRSLTWEYSLLSPGLGPINTNFLSGCPLSPDSPIGKVPFNKFSYYLFFVGPHMARRKKKFLNLVTLEMQAITSEALFALLLPPLHTALCLQAFQEKSVGL